jgi:hypothetical protein
VTTRRWSAAVVRSQQPRCTDGIPSDDPRTDGGGGGDAIGSSCTYGEAPTIAGIMRDDNIVDSASTKKIFVKKKSDDDGVGFTCYFRL